MKLATIVTSIALPLALLLPAAAPAQEPIDPVPHAYPRLQRIAPKVILAAATSLPTRTVAVAHGGSLTLHDRQPHGLRATISLPSGDIA